jgi:hypothetical protein
MLSFILAQFVIVDGIKIRMVIGIAILRLILKSILQMEKNYLTVQHGTLMRGIKNEKILDGYL